MIQFFTGKPGDGKTLFAVRQIIDDLCTSDCFVVTNIPLNVPAVCEYVGRRRDDFRFDDRVRIIGDNLVYEFYRVRAGGVLLEASPDMLCKNEAAKRLPRPEFVEVMKTIFLTIKTKPEAQIPTRYYIDEAHNYFNAREWANAGRGLLYYASQHRHLHDEIVLITQVMENVEKQLRSLASETHAIRNNLRRRIGLVRLRPRFVVRSFYGVQADTGKPFSTATFELDVKGIAGCYQTVGALGVFSKPEAKVNKAPLPWWSLWVLGFCAVGLVVGGFTSLPYLGGAMARKVIGGGGSSQESASPPAVADAAPVARPSVASARMVASDTRTAGGFESATWCTGYVIRAGLVNALLSDGTTVTESEALTRIGRNAITLNGRAYALRATARPASRDLGVQVASVQRVAPDGGSRQGASKGSLDVIADRNTSSESPRPVVYPAPTPVSSNLGPLTPEQAPGLGGEVRPSGRLEAGARPGAFVVRGLAPVGFR